MGWCSTNNNGLIRLKSGYTAVTLHAASGSGFGNGIGYSLDYLTTVKDAVDNKGLTQGTKQSELLL